MGKQVRRAIPDDLHRTVQAKLSDLPDDSLGLVGHDDHQLVLSPECMGSAGRLEEAAQVLAREIATNIEREWRFNAEGLFYQRR